MGNSSRHPLCSASERVSTWVSDHTQGANGCGCASLVQEKVDDLVVRAKKDRKTPGHEREKRGERDGMMADPHRETLEFASSL